MTRIFQAFIAAACLLAALTASATDSARELLAAGRVDEALTMLNARLAASPTDAESANLLCRSYYAMADWDRAESACRKATSLDSAIGRYHLWLGRVYGEIADHNGPWAGLRLAGKIRDEFERAVQLEPKELDSRLDLSEFYIGAPGFVGGGTDKAQEQAKIVSAANPGREHWIYARIAEKKNKPEIAEQEYHQFIELSRGDAEAWENLALFLRRQKRIDEMEKAIIQVSQAPVSRPEVLFESAQMLHRAGRNYPLAVQLLRQYFLSGPVEAAPAFKAHHLLGLLLENQGDKAAAAEQYRAALALFRNFTPAQQGLKRVAH